MIDPAATPIVAAEHRADDSVAVASNAAETRIALQVSSDLVLEIAFSNLDAFHLFPECNSLRVVGNQQFAGLNRRRGHAR